jgi:antitoxin (DNA-binding transcriptional repressor) of toxin-antitoxin stability system
VFEQRCLSDGRLVGCGLRTTRPRYSLRESPPAVVRDGQEVTVTDHGRAVARLVPLDRPRPLDRLIAEGLVTPAGATKRSRRGGGIAADGNVSDLVAEQRR